MTSPYASNMPGAAVSGERDLKQLLEEMESRTRLRECFLINRGVSRTNATESTLNSYARAWRSHQAACVRHIDKPRCPYRTPPSKGSVATPPLPEFLRRSPTMSQPLRSGSYTVRSGNVRVHSRCGRIVVEIGRSSVAERRFHSNFFQAHLECARTHIESDMPRVDLGRGDIASAPSRSGSDSIPLA
jgi:hypothetical protein